MFATIACEGVTLVYLEDLEAELNHQQRGYSRSGREHGTHRTQAAQLLLLHAYMRRAKVAPVFLVDVGEDVAADRAGNAVLVDLVAAFAAPLSSNGVQLAAPLCADRPVGFSHEVVVGASVSGANSILCVPIHPAPVHHMLAWSSEVWWCDCFVVWFVSFSFPCSVCGQICGERRRA